MPRYRLRTLLIVSLIHSGVAGAADLLGRTSFVEGVFMKTTMSSRRAQTFSTVLILSIGIVANYGFAEDVKELYGTWKVEMAMEGGRPVNDAVGEFVVFAIGRAEQQDKQGRRKDHGLLKIDSKAEPATIDICSASREVAQLAS